MTYIYSWINCIMEHLNDTVLRKLTNFKSLYFNKCAISSSLSNILILNEESLECKFLPNLFPKIVYG